VACELSRTLLHGYLDGELDAAGAAEFERHLETCRECTAALDAQEALRSAILRGGLYERAPSSLLQRINAEMGGGPKQVRASSRRVWMWLATAATAAVLVLSVWIAARQFQRARGDELFASAAVDAHLRSLQPGHLTDVASTDQHTVKPWFEGKLDFAPPVRDLAADGFPLVGGRLDVVKGNTVPALVYARRKHFISVFVWPSEDSAGPPGSGSIRGYQWLYWRSHGMDFCAVTDASAGDLTLLAKLLAE
jgi:anti-sigma factor (TIGR02949 family)